VVVFLSDHGEQLGEHGGGGHTGSLYDVEVKIPAWIDAPEQTLSEGERTALSALRKRPTITVDVFPTVMDLLGLWDRPRIESLGYPIRGESLLRGGSPVETPLRMSNCTELWACAFKNWGAISGTRKLFASQADGEWHCFDVATDPEEKHPLPKETCADLLPLAEAQGRPF
jgi:arylsulfatase A-like enzyme